MNSGRIDDRLPGGVARNRHGADWEGFLIMPRVHACLGRSVGFAAHSSVQISDLLPFAKSGFDLQIAQHGLNTFCQRRPLGGSLPLLSAAANCHEAGGIPAGTRFFQQRGVDCRSVHLPLTGVLADPRGHLAPPDQFLTS